MNDDISIDIQAEQKTFSDAIQPSELAQSAPQIAQQAASLPESLPIRPTQIPIVTDAIADVAKVSVDLKVNFDAEAAVKNLSSRVDDLAENIGNAVNNAGNKWLPDPKSQNKFEERPTTQAINYIFDVRSIEFSESPYWS